MPRPSFLSPFLRGPERRYALHNSRNGLVVATHIEVALDSASRRRGLLGRDGLDPGAALVIAPCNAIHTFFMRFAIDVIFVARDGRILKTYSALVHRRIAFSLRAFAVIELPVGALAQSAATVGDIIQLS